jgi:hypothetical protein
MAKKVRVKSGSTTADVSPELAQSIEKTLNALAPETKATIENAIEEIYQEAYKDWPVRYRKKRSKDSKNKLERGITLDISDGSVYGFIRKKHPDRSPPGSQGIKRITLEAHKKTSRSNCRSSG